jgi:drug/metabolite transporter (DMT)-like permease
MRPNGHPPPPGRPGVQGRGRLAFSVVLVGLAWGAMYALYPIGLERSGPAWLAALRFDAFFLGALAVALWRRQGVLPRGARDWAAVAAYAGLNVVLHNLALMAGSRHVPVAAVGIATGLNPLLTVLLSRLVLPGSRVPPAALLGLAAGLAGVGLLAVQGGAGGGAVDPPWAAVVLGGVLAWSAGSVGLKATRSTLPPLALAVWGALLGAVALHAVALGEPPPRVDLPYAGTVLFAGLVGGLAAFLLWGGIVRDHGPQRANLASYVSPVAASLAAWALLGQGLGWVHLAAYALVALGLTLALRAAPAPSAPLGAE